MAAEKKTKKKGKKDSRKTKNRIDKKMLFGGMMAAVLGIIVAGLWIYRGLNGEEGAAIFTIVATAGTALASRLTKHKAFFKRAIIIICVFFLFYGGGLIVGKIVIKDEIEDIQNLEEVVTKKEETEGNEEEYKVKTFTYEEDVLFEDLVYYVDGCEIKKDDTKIVLKNFIKKNLFCGKLPERYEDDKEQLNNGVYAKKTKIGSDYYESYKCIKSRDIKEEHKLLFAKEARKNMKEADNEYVTIENSRNIVWACEATRQELWLCIDEINDEEEINEWKDESKECNREIMKAVWNILQIEFCLGREISRDMKNKLIEAYEWERDHMPEKNVNYDELINAFKDVLDD